MARSSSRYRCQSCGWDSPKWLGRCPSCAEWDTFAEERAGPPKGKERSWIAGVDENRSARPLSELADSDTDRIATGIGELDRALGGGLARGSLTLLGGDPGIGKSTLALQLALSGSSFSRALYVSGEESAAQVKMRADRIGLDYSSLLFSPETSVESIGEIIAGAEPRLIIIDSIQTIYTEELAASPGSVGQIREAASILLRICKTIGAPTILIGHVTKEGAIAGPKLLEHMVDTVLYFEGAADSELRILRAVKNRFGAANEVALFQMREKGLEEVRNPSAALLAGRAEEISGSAIAPTLAGARPLLIEIQALVASSPYATPRRTAVGIDSNRLAIMIAIIEKRIGLTVATEDIFVNVVGGMRLDDPALDLAVGAAIVSGMRDIPLAPDLVLVGEIGLGGEIRGAARLESRLKEAHRLGFSRAIAPKSKSKLDIPTGLRVDECATFSAALDILLP